MPTARTRTRQSKAKPKPGSRIAFRLDLRRALFEIVGVSGLLLLTLFIAGQRRVENSAAQEFGNETRVGSILVLPLTGDTCRQIAFNNDSGAVIEGEPIS